MGVREDILVRAEEAFASRGYGSTSLDEIAGELGLTKAAIYHYFGSKRALLTALLDQSLAAAEGALTRDAPLQERLQAYADVYRDQLEPLTAVVTARSNRRGGDRGATRIAVGYMQRSVALLEAALADAVGAGRARLLAPIFSTLVHGAHMMAQHHPAVDREALVDEGIRVFCLGIEATPSEPSREPLEAPS